jgi:hypothetical protein
MSFGLNQTDRVNDVPPVFLVQGNYSHLLNRLYAGLRQTDLWERVRGSCFCTAGFVSLAMTALGHLTRVLPCYAVALKDGALFALGNKDSHVAPGQIDGHVVCLVDETILVDFGLGNLCRDKDFHDFPNAIAYEVNSIKIFPNEIVLGEDRRIIWANGWANPRMDEMMAEHRPAIELLYKQYNSLPRMTPSRDDPSKGTNRWHASGMNPSPQGGSSSPFRVQHHQNPPPLPPPRSETAGRTEPVHLGIPDGSSSGCRS